MLAEITATVLRIVVRAFARTRARSAASVRGCLVALAFAAPAMVGAGQTPAERAQTAVELLREGQADSVWPLLRAGADNTLRSHVARSLGAGDAELIAERLEVEPDPSIRRALILGLGALSVKEIAGRDALVDLLLDAYQNDPDPGIHSAIDWLLRRGDGQSPLSEELGEIDLEAAGKFRLGRRWQVTAEGQTLATIDGPVEVRMGSPASEAGRVPAVDSPDEPLRLVRIPRSFAIATKEVTVAEWQHFLDTHPDARARFAYADDPTRMATVLQRFSPDLNGPIIAVTWYEAAMYCNWLSALEGLPESEWVYPVENRSGMRLPPNYLQRTGYRLPTEAEWEYAARAGSTTSRFFGEDAGLLSDFAWYRRNPPRFRGDPVDPADPQRTFPVGRLKPNDLGLFDVYGNVWEWTLDRMQESFPPRYDDAEDEVLLVSDEVARTRRGGAYAYGAAFQRSANRDTRNAYPLLRRDNVGFRIARTLRDGA